MCQSFNGQRLFLRHYRCYFFTIFSTLKVWHLNVYFFLFECYPISAIENNICVWKKRYHMQKVSYLYIFLPKSSTFLFLNLFISTPIYSTGSCFDIAFSSFFFGFADIPQWRTKILSTVTSLFVIFLNVNWFVWYPICANGSSSTLWLTL
jgi:hypothetical protein